MPWTYIPACMGPWVEPSPSNTDDTSARPEGAGSNQPSQQGKVILKLERCLMFSADVNRDGRIRDKMHTLKAYVKV